VARILDLCRPQLIRCWSITGDALDRLRDIINETEAEAFGSLRRCNGATDLSRFFARYVSRILGAPVPFSERSVSDDLMMGIRYLGTDPILHTAVGGLFLEICTGTKQLLQDYDKSKSTRSERASTVGAFDLPKGRGEPSKTAAVDGVEFTPDGKLILRPRDGGLTDFVQQLALVLRRNNLKGNDLLIATKWVEKVTGKPIRDGVWESEHDEAFVRAHERSCWEGNWPTGGSPDLANVTAHYRKVYPVLAGSPIDVGLNDEMRRLFRRILGG
jgi:hypothetical protein